MSTLPNVKCHVTFDILRNSHCFEIPENLMKRTSCLVALIVIVSATILLGQTAIPIPGQRGGGEGQGQRGGCRVGKSDVEAPAQAPVKQVVTPISSAVVVTS